MRLSEAQDFQLRRLAGKSIATADFDRIEQAWCWVPYRSELRTYKVLERKGLVVWRSVDKPGISQNGYRLTELGKRLAK